jgi:predicted transcriptional regulator
MRKYTEEEEFFLKENFLEKTNATLAKELDRSIDGIAQKLKEMGLIRREMNPYSEEEKVFIQENLGKLSINEIAKQLGRSQGGISKYISKFRISKIRKSKKTYFENIEKGVVPFYSKSDNYFEILEKMKVGDSFSFPENDKAIVNSQKYLIINSQKAKNKPQYLFSIRKTEKIEDVQFCRIWRLA